MSRLRVAPLPGRVREAPYLRLLHQALARRGIETLELPSARAAVASRPDVLHLHWLEYLARAESGGPLAWLRAHLRGLALMRALHALRRRGTRIVWTVHNLRPHEPRHPRLERLLARFVLRRADRVIAHSRFAARRVAELYGDGADRVEVIPHGHFIGFYPPPQRSRDEVRDALRIPRDAFVYLLFGQLRRYKGVPAAIAAFRRLPYADARLVVAGAVRDPALEREIAAAAAGDGRVRQLLGHVPDERVAELHEAADAALIPYGEVFSSGALLLALSLGLPAVAPAEGTGELAEPPALEPFSGERGLTDAMEAIRWGDAARRRDAARRSAERFSWDEIARRTRAAYEEVGA
jgi:beta-1,4-mannosyltransferase